MSDINIFNLSFSKTELALITHFFKHYKEELNARQIARTIGINHAHSYKLCSELEKKRLLKKRVLGTMTYYSFFYEDPYAIKFMEYVLSLENMNSKKHIQVIEHVLREFSDYTKIMLLFGSAVHSKNYRDIDVLLMYEKKNKAKIAKIKENIRAEGLLEKPVHYVDMSFDDLEKNKNNPVFYPMLSNNIILQHAAAYAKVIAWLASRNT